MAIISPIARRRNFPVGEKVPLRDLPGITVRAFPALMMPVVLLGFIYSGVTTPTEAAAIAAAYAFLISALLYREVTLAGTYASLLSSARTTASIGMLIAGAMVFNYVVTVENIPQALSAALQGRELVAGRLSPARQPAAARARLPAGRHDHPARHRAGAHPTAEALGIDMVHFGVVVVVNIMLGLITPPYGLLLFIMTNISGAPFRAIVRDTLPFLFAHAGRARADHLRARRSCSGCRACSATRDEP